ncbi:hypothetical protein RQP46_010243 [Phenoliferia psychrophenolica]
MAYPNYNQSGNTGYSSQQPYGAPQQSGSPYPQPGGGAGAGSPYPPPAGQSSPYGAPSGYPQQNQAYGAPYSPQGQQAYASFPSPGAYGAPGAPPNASPYPQQGGTQGAYPPQYPQYQAYAQPQGQSGPTGEAASFYNPQSQAQSGQPDRGLLGMAAAGGIAYMAYSAYSNSGNHNGKMFGAAHQAAGPGAASDPNYLLQILRQTVQEQKIGAFYGPGSLEQIAQKVVRERSLQRIAHQWQMPVETAIDLVRLALFDIIIYADDSGSMRFEEGGKRIEELKMIVGRTAFAASLFDQDGIQIRFMNSKIDGQSNTEAGAIDIVNKVEYVYQTPLGTSLQKRVLEPLVLDPAKHNKLRKPVLIIMITDGAPSGEDHFKIVSVIKSANHDLAKTRYGPDAVSYQLAQVGEDSAARKFLEEIDVHHNIGKLVDVTSNFENEADNLRKAKNPITLNPSLWVIKLLLGGISSDYDFKDE